MGHDPGGFRIWWRCGRSLEKLPELVVQAKSILERFMDALSCIDQCSIADRMLEQLRRAAYDLKKLRGKKIVRRIGRTRRYESSRRG